MNYNNYAMPYPYVGMPAQAAMSTGPSYAQRYEVTRVSGENGARAFGMAPNSSVLLLDETAPIVWLKTTDGAGYPTLKPYSITPLETEAPVDTRSLESRVARLEEIINAKSDAGAARRQKSKSATGTEAEGD